MSKTGEVEYEAAMAKKQRESRLTFNPLTSNIEWWRYKIRCIYEFLYPLNEDIILDFGSGSCECSEFLAEKGSRVIALDLSPDLLSISKERLRRSKRKPNLEFVVGDCENLPFRNNAFTKLLCWATLHHMPNAKKSVAEMYTVLKSNGLCLIHEPNALNAFRRMSEFRWEEPNFESSFYPWELRRLAKQTGFNAVKQDYRYQPGGAPWTKNKAKKTFGSYVIGWLRAKLTKKIERPLRYFFGDIIVLLIKPGSKEECQ